MAVSAVVSIGVLRGIFMFPFALGRRYIVLMSILFEIGLSVVTEWWSDGWIPTPEQDAVVSLIALRPYMYSSSAQLYGQHFSYVVCGLT
jgi:hypothetical protein